MLLINFLYVQVLQSFDFSINAARQTLYDMYLVNEILNRG